MARATEETFLFLHHFELCRFALDLAVQHSKTNLARKETISAVAAD